MPNSKTFLSQLTEDDQQHLKHCVKKLLTSLRASESRLQSYNAVNAEAEDQSVLKLITNLKETLAMTEDTINDYQAWIAQRTRAYR